MGDFLSYYAGHSTLQIIALFIAPFILEEAALIGGAAVAAAKELSAWTALTAIYLGVVVSDWVLYATGVLAGRSERVKDFVGVDNIAQGRKLLRKSGWAAALTARLVPWLLLPIFIASGFLRVGFLKFAVINAVIAFVYVNVLFWALYRFEILLLDYLKQWTWLVIALLVVVVVVCVRLGARKFSRSSPAGARSPNSRSPNAR